MCLIAWRQADGPTIPAEVVTRNIAINPDGFGIMWRDAEGVGHRKFAPSERDEFTEMLARIDAAGLEYGAHWRKATHGPTDREMAHPYPYVDASGTPIVAMHNGIVSIKTDKHESDTHRFVHAVLAKMETGWWEQNHLRFLVEGAIGWSRFLLMTPTETVVLNPEEWVTHEGIDYSCKPLWTPPPKGGYTYKGGQQVWPPKDEPVTLSKEKDGLGFTIREVTGKPDPLLLPVPSARNVGSESNGGASTGSTVSKYGEEPSDWEVENFGPFWVHNGHYVMKLLPGDGEAGEAACWDCGEEGDWYAIGNATFFDIDHFVDITPKQEATA